METITLADYIQYGFLAFIGLLLIVMLVALLRQGRDIGELKGELRGTNRRIDAVNNSLSDRIESVNTNLSNSIDAVSSSLSDRIDAVNNSLSDRIDAVNNSLSDRIESVNTNLSNSIAAVSSNLSDRIESVNTNLSDRIDAVNNSLSDRMDRLEVRLERLEITVTALGREISETKGLLLSLHERVDLMMRHRHDPDDGQVLLTPEEVAAD